MSLQRDMYMAPVIKYLEEKKNSAELDSAAAVDAMAKVKKDLLAMAKKYGLGESYAHSSKHSVGFETPKDILNEFRMSALKYLGVSSFTDYPTIDYEDPTQLIPHSKRGETKFKNIFYHEYIFNDEPDILVIRVYIEL